MSKKTFWAALAVPEDTDIELTLTALPFFESVAAGFPSPATDYTDSKLDLNELCIKNPSATFFIRVSGDSMHGAGISDGDILIVDRSLKPKIRDIVVAIVDNDFTVKRLFKQGKRILLVAENSHYPPIIIEENTDFEIWGTVKMVLHHV